jgi:hypothetical protein
VHNIQVKIVVLANWEILPIVKRTYDAIVEKITGHSMEIAYTSAQSTSVVASW